MSYLTTMCRAHPSGAYVLVTTFGNLRLSPETEREYVNATPAEQKEFERDMYVIHGEEWAAGRELTEL